MFYFKLFGKLWNDDCGGILTSEYVMLGGILGVGTVSGLSSMRDASVDEMKEMSNSYRSVREYYTPKEFQRQQRQPAGDATGQPARDSRPTVTAACP